MQSPADVVNAAVQLVGGYNNNGAVTGSPPDFDGSTVGEAAGAVYDEVVQAIGRKFGWDFARNVVTLVLTGDTPPLGYAYEYQYPPTGIQLRQLVPPTVNAAARLDPRPQRWTVGNSDSPSAAASGYIQFSVNPTNGSTITLNGRVFTFVNDSSGWPNNVSNYKINIAGNLAGTLAFLSDPDAGALTTGTTYLADTALNVASYVNTSVRLLVTYASLGTAGNNYTLAASVATRSGPTLTGGADAQQKVIWTDLASAVGVILNQPPESVWDPLFTEAVIRLLASYLDLALAGKASAAEALLQSASAFAQVGEGSTDT